MKFLFCRQFFNTSFRFVFLDKLPEPVSPVSEKPEDKKGKRADLLAKLDGHLDFEQPLDLDNNDKKELNDVSRQAGKLLYSLDKTMELLASDNKEVDTKLKAKLVSSVRGTVHDITGELEVDPAKVSKENVNMVFNDLGETFKTVDYNPSTGVLDITDFNAIAKIDGNFYSGIYTKGAKKALSVEPGLPQGATDTPAARGSGDDEETPKGLSPSTEAQVPYGLANVGPQYKMGPFGTKATMGSYGQGFSLSAALPGGFNAYGGVYTDAGSMLGLTRDMGNGTYIDLQVFPGTTPKPGDSMYYLTYGFPSSSLKKIGVESAEIGAYSGTGPQLTGNNAPKPMNGDSGAGLTIGGRF